MFGTFTTAAVQLPIGLTEGSRQTTAADSRDPMLLWFARLAAGSLAVKPGLSQQG